MNEDPYLIPGTETLYNLRGITDPTVLAEFEGRMAEARMVQLETGAVEIQGQFDLDHLMAHHRHVFQDVYPWAGEVRTVSIAKASPDGAMTAFCEPQFIHSEAAKIFDDLTRANHLRDLDRDAFVVGAAHVLVEANVLHPAREGNGRAQRAFMLSLARQAGWDLDWGRVGLHRNIEASVAGYRGDERPMAELLDDITTRQPPPGPVPQGPPGPQRGPPSARRRARGPIAPAQQGTRIVH